MKVLLFEWFTGGGLYTAGSGDLHDASDLLPMGAKMVSAVAADFEKCADVDLLIDERVDWPSRHFAELHINGADRNTRVHAISSPAQLKDKITTLAQAADVILVIAPETDGCLISALGWLQDHQAKIIQPEVDFVALVSDKNRLPEYLSEKEFSQMPHGIGLAQFDTLPAADQANWFPMVVKPFDGAGSDGLQYFPTIEDYSLWRSSIPADQVAGWRVERYIAGTPVSVSVIFNRESEHTLLPPTIQIFDRQPIGEWVDADSNVEAAIASRATRLVKAAIEKLPPTLGYVGFDTVIADDGDSQDVLIEINPRITMSYLKLREICEANLTKLMVAGRNHPSLHSNNT
jgi:predicted ATP-grasp superfamily ATP-dependent carboligase